jgi:spermidine/putrescine transport system ATP-binding protein
VVNRPSVLLLDEPLGALDLQLRRQMQLELKALQKQLGITFIYITHDQEEALNMSDRIAVMKDGRFEQLGTPAEVYDSPRTSYVARFVGTANVLTGTVEAVEDDVLKVACAGGCAGALRRGYSFAPGAPITLAVRSEHVEFTKDPAACGIAALSGKRRLPAACCASHWSFPTARRSSPAATALIWMCRRATRCA